jgi:hypothetical protein
LLLFLPLAAKAQFQPAKNDSLKEITRQAQKLVISLMEDEKNTLRLIKSLRRQTEKDSLLLLEQLELQKRQRANLLALSNELSKARKNHRALVKEIDKIRPRPADLIIPVSAGAAAFIFTNGDNSQKALAGTAFFALLITLKHFGVY